MPSAVQLRAQIESSLGERFSMALQPRERVAPLTVPFGVPSLDALCGGLPRGALSEVTGAVSTGRTSIVLSALAAALRRQETCALVDASDSFDPVSAAAAGLDLARLLWIRCSSASSSSSQNKGKPHLGRLEQVLKVTDLLVQGSGFGMVVLDLGDIPVENTRRIPLTSWFRFRRVVEPTATVLLILEEEPSARSCASLVVQLEREAVCARDSAPAFERELAGWSVVPRPNTISDNPAISHAVLLDGIHARARVTRSWSERKPAQSAGAHFQLRTAW